MPNNLVNVKETKIQYIDCTDFTPGLNTLDDPIDLPIGGSPYILNMDITKKGKLISRNGYELIAQIGTGAIRGMQTYYRTYDEGTTPYDQNADPNGAYANTYQPPVAISELAVNKLFFTPSSAFKSRVYKIGVWVVAKGTGNWTVTLHDASNNLLASKTIGNGSLTNGQFNFFEVPYNWTSGALHFHVTSTVADGTLKSNVAADLSTASFEEIYRTSGDYLIVHSADGNSYYITASSSTPVTIGAWGTDGGSPVRGATFDNLAIYSDGTGTNVVKQWDMATLSNVSGATQANIFTVFQKRLFTNNVLSPSAVNYSDVDAPTSISSNFVNITKGDGWNVTGMVANNDFLQVFKTDTINGINFSFDNSYNLTVPQLQPIAQTQGGAWATDSIQAVYGNTYYMSNKGFETYGPTPDRIVADKPLPLSLEIEPTWKTVNMVYPNSIVSAFFDNKYICAAPLNSATIASHCFVYNENVKRRFGRDNWTMYDDIPASAFVKFRNSQKRDELYWASAIENKLFKFNDGFSDNGNGYQKIWTSKTFKFGERTNYYYLDLEGVKTLNSIIDLLVYTDQVLARDTITDDNLVSQSLSGAYVGDSAVGATYIGGGYTGTSAPLYKWKKRFYFPSTVNYGYSMYFIISNQENAAGYGINRYVLAYKMEPEEPTYARTE